jgi:hypothetical protein
VPFGPGVHGLLVVAHTSLYFHLQTDEIGIVGICFQPKPYRRQCRIELARVFVKRRAIYLEDHSFHSSCFEGNDLTGIYFFYLVFGKTVRFRHYPVTVGVESLAIGMKPLERKFWEGCPGSGKRKSGDRPDSVRA